LGVLVSHGEQAQFRAAQVLALDREHDLAQLRIRGTPLTALQLGDSSKVAEGKTLAFTGFPLGMLLGLHHVTHRGMVSAITPVAMAAPNAAKLDTRLAALLGKPAYAVFQLDGTAYPGNSGSPLFDPDTGQVVGVINMVYVRGAKESATSNPSGITYAVPANFIRAMTPDLPANAAGPAR
jgi:S1-C subfamily serine protease